MEHVAALLMLVGCSTDLGECRELPAPTAMFETMDECDSRLNDALVGAAGAYPRVFANCIELDPALEEVDAEIVWDVTNNGGLVASVELIGNPGILVASSNDRTGGETVSRR
jgi:hypothetical protein